MRATIGLIFGGTIGMTVAVGAVTWLALHAPNSWTGNMGIDIALVSVVTMCVTAGGAIAGRVAIGGAQ